MPGVAASGVSALDHVVRRDRAIIAAALAVVVVIAWWYLVTLAGTSAPAMRADMMMPHAEHWAPVQPVALFAMWSVMMVAMMLPSAAPMILLFAAVTRRRRVLASPAAPVAVFVAGYLVMWAAFSAIALLAQLALHRAALLSPMMATTDRGLGALLLIGAGLYQWTPLKRACLGHCRSPLAFFGAEWREGWRGALMMGMRHGAFCLGCCWALMALLFVAGVMNLLWVAVLAVVVLVEKTTPRGALMGRVAGAIFGVSGVAMLVTRW